MTDEFAPETVGEEASVEEPAYDHDDANQDGEVSEYELATRGPSEEQLTAEPYSTAPEIPDVLLAAARGEQVVTSLPLELQGGDSLYGPPEVALAQEEQQDNTEES